MREKMCAPIGCCFIHLFSISLFTQTLMYLLGGGEKKLPSAIFAIRSYYRMIEIICPGNYIKQWAFV